MYLAFTLAAGDTCCAYASSFGTARGVLVETMRFRLAWFRSSRWERLTIGGLWSYHMVLLRLLNLRVDFSVHLLGAAIRTLSTRVLRFCAALESNQKNLAFPHVTREMKIPFLGPVEV